MYSNWIKVFISHLKGYGYLNTIGIGGEDDVSTIIATWQVGTICQKRVVAQAIGIHGGANPQPTTGILAGRVDRQWSSSTVAYGESNAGRFGTEINR